MEHYDEGIVGTLLTLEPIWSPQLKNARPIFVHLPWGYEAGEARFPVLYMHDGQNLFSPALSFGGEWEVDETLEALRRRGLQAIVVGIPNLGQERINEYSPFVDPQYGGGKGEQYLAFIAETLKPQIDASFRTLPERISTGIMGSSLGGLISIYGFLRYPELFGFCGCMSPALWFGEHQIFAYVEQSPFVGGRIYLDVGTDEGDEALAGAVHLYQQLIAKGYRVGRDLLYLEELHADHSESEWADRLYTALRFLLRAAVREVGK